ncbi:hypothetical protein ND6B_3319 [Pseudoalteromonas sp. ND6B]|jgi:hypothetical protein|nr:hypothetical protein ND6B_3319 [Pseudoalteromonas sp. ND6B]
MGGNGDIECFLCVETRTFQCLFLNLYFLNH